MMSDSPIHLQPEEAVSPTTAHPLHSGGHVLRNTAATLAGRGLALFFSVGAAVVLARFLGSERLGEFGAIYAYLALFGWMAAFGFEPVLVREISRERQNASNLLHTAVVMSCFLAIGTIAVAILVAPKAGYTGHLRNLLILASLEYVLTPLRLPAVMFQTDMRQWYGATINVIRQGIWFVIVVVLWFLGASLVYIIASRVLAAVIESCLLWVYGRRFILQTGSFLRTRAAEIFSHSFPIAFTSLLATIYLRIDQVMLHKMVSDAVLGQYVAAVKVSELFEMLPSALMLSLAPILSVNVAVPVRFRSYTDRVFRYFMLLSCALCIFMTVGARLVIHTMYGNQFLPAVPLLAVLIWSEISVFFAAVVVNVLIAKNQQRFLPIPTLIGAAINVALNLFLIPRYGALGASWATLVSYTMAWTVALLFFKQTRSVTWQGLRFALPIAAIALSVTLCTVISPLPEIANTFLALTAFAVCAGIFRYLQKSDLTYVSTIVKDSVVRFSS